MKSISTSAKFFAATIIALLAAALLCVSALGSTAYAGEVEMVNTLKAKTVKVSYLPGNSRQNTIEYYCLDKKVSNVKSSKKAVASAKLRYIAPEKFNGYTTPAYYIIEVKLKKAGSTKLSFKLGGKKYTTTLQVYKYSSPIKSIKIANKENPKLLTSKKLVRGVQSYGAMTKMSAIKGKVKVVATKGWKLNKIYYEAWKNVGKPTQKIVKKTVKNGSTVKEQFCVELKNKKTGLIERFWFYPDYSQYMKY